jgi:transcriptional regulator with XRE-family HTH domain
MRLDKELTQTELAARLGQPQSYVSKYESGERRLDLPELRAIASALGGNLQQLIAHFEESL